MRHWKITGTRYDVQNELQTSDLSRAKNLNRMPTGIDKVYLNNEFEYKLNIRREYQILLWVSGFGLFVVES